MTDTTQDKDADISWVETRDASKHPSVQRTAPAAKNYLVQNVSSAKVEILFFRISTENEEAGSPASQSPVIACHCYGLEDYSRPGAKIGLGHEGANSDFPCLHSLHTPR